MSKWNCSMSKWKCIYIASDRRNLIQISVTAALKSVGFDVYDLHNPAPDSDGFRSDFSWKWMKKRRRLDPARWHDSQCHLSSQHLSDMYMDAMGNAGCCVLILPCDGMAHVEAGIMAGQGKPVFTLAMTPVEDKLFNCLGVYKDEQTQPAPG